MKNHLLDIVLGLPLIWGLIRGFLRGFIFEITILGALVVGSVGSFFLAERVSRFTTETFPDMGNWPPVLSHLVVFLAIFILIYFIGKSLTNVIDSVGLGFMNRLAGGIFGLLKWALIVSVFVFLFYHYDINYRFISLESRETSHLFDPMAKGAKLLYEFFNKD